MGSSLSMWVSAFPISRLEITAGNLSREKNWFFVASSQSTERERIGDWLVEFCERRKSEGLRKANGRVQGVLWLRAWDTVGGSSTGRRSPKARGWQGFLAWIWILSFHVHESCVSRKTLLRLELVPDSKEGRKEESFFRAFWGFARRRESFV